MAYRVHNKVNDASWRRKLSQISHSVLTESYSLRYQEVFNKRGTLEQ